VGLARAFRETRYVAGDAVAQVGRRSPGMARLLRQMGARQGGFLTAWNPLARRHAPGWNARAQAALAQAARRLPTMPARSVPLRDARWVEAQLLLAADSRVARRLARRFRQKAILWIAADGMVSLVWIYNS
jgi:hypothetical protein